MLTKMLFPPYRASSGPVTLDQVLPSAVFDLDATIAASYPGAGTTWSNLVTFPADGALQTAYDFHTGDGATAATYPAFNGAAGNQMAYWVFDGGDYFRLKSGANTHFLGNMHKTGGADFWLAITGQWASTASAGLFSTKEGNVPGIDMLAYNGASGKMAWRQRGAVEAGLYPATPVMTAGQDFIAIYTHSHATGKSRIYLNSASASETTHVFSGTSASSSLATIGSLGGATLPLPYGFRLYSAAGGNAYLDDTGASAIISTLNARHNRIYV